jgi:hypothetical protein
MGYYNVLILTPRDKTGRSYHTESIYFGEIENMMRVKFYEAVRKAQQMSNAELVVIMHDGDMLVRVKIEH